jgi:hypothetical protein
MAHPRLVDIHQAGRGSEAFNTLLYQRLDATLEEYLSAFEG